MTLTESFLCAAVIDAFFRLKWGRPSWRRANPRTAADVSSILDSVSGKGAYEAWDAARNRHGEAY